MRHKIEIESTTYYIAHGPDALHFGCVGRGQVLSSGQPNMETFADSDDWHSRVLELSGERPININTADAETLQTLSGVGASLADQIIVGRPWESPLDLAQIGGVSAGMVEGWMANPGLDV